MHRHTAPLLALAVVALVAAACVAGTSPSPSPSSTAASSGSVPASMSPSTTASGVPSGEAPSASVPSQTDTAWGRIWDALPPSFPRYAGANPTDTGEGAASGQLEVPGTVDQVAAFYKGALEAAGYATLSLSGPMEDGSRQLESQGSAAGCRVRTTIAPHGTTTLVTVLYGAACPF